MRIIGIIVVDHNDFLCIKCISFIHSKKLVPDCNFVSCTVFQKKAIPWLSPVNPRRD